MATKLDSMRVSIATTLDLMHYYRGIKLEAAKKYDKALKHYLKISPLFQMLNNVEDEHKLPISNLNFDIGCYYYFGLGTEKNVATARAYFTKAYKEGIKAARYYIQYDYVEFPESPQELKEAQNWIEHAYLYSEDDPKTVYLLALFSSKYDYMNPMTLRHAESAVRLGYPGAEILLEKIKSDIFIAEENEYAYICRNYKDDPKRALVMLEANGHHAKSAYLMSKMYSEGIGTEVDKEMADFYLVEAANRGDKRAYCAAGLLCYNGQVDIIKNGREKAKEFFTEGLKPENLDACPNDKLKAGAALGLADILRTEGNYKDSLYWLAKAEEWSQKDFNEYRESILEDMRSGKQGTPVSSLRDNVKPQKKASETASSGRSRVKKSLNPKLILIPVLAVMVAMCINVYLQCFVPKSPVLLDKDQIAYVVVDGYYDVFDYRLDDKEDWEMISQYLDYFEYVKVLNPFEKVEDSGKRIGVTFYDKDGKQLEEIICYNDERIRVNGALCKPVNMNGGNFTFPGSLTLEGKIRMEESFQPEIDNVILSAIKEDDGSVTIDLPEIPYPEGVYSAIWVVRTNSDSDDTESIYYLGSSKGKYDQFPGGMINLPLLEDSEGEKYLRAGLRIDAACGAVLYYDLSGIIPEGLRAEEEE